MTPKQRRLAISYHGKDKIDLASKLLMQLDKRQMGPYTDPVEVDPDGANALLNAMLNPDMAEVVRENFFRLRERAWSRKMANEAKARSLSGARKSK